MTGRSPLVLLAVLALSALGCASCGEAPPAFGGESGGAPASAPPAVPPTPPTAPMPPPVPAAIACATDADCVLGQFPAPVDERATCSCPECPVALNRATETRNAATWQATCAGWPGAATCQPPMCPPPLGPVACVDGACRQVGNGAR